MVVESFVTFLRFPLSLFKRKKMWNSHPAPFFPFLPVSSPPSLLPLPRWAAGMLLYKVNILHLESVIFSSILVLFSRTDLFGLCHSSSVVTNELKLVRAWSIYLCCLCLSRLLELLSCINVSSQSFWSWPSCLTVWLPLVILSHIHQFLFFIALLNPSP